MNRALVLLVSLFLAGCTPLANSAGSAAPTTRTTAPCPVTLAYEMPPDEVIEWSARGSTSALTHEQMVEAARQTNWVGGGGIWVALPPDGIVTWGTTTQGSKLGLFAYGVGRVTAGAHRVGAPTPPGFEAKIGTPEEGYGPPGFIASGLVFPENGCWEVTYRIDRSGVTFVVNVRP
jgi:hypothetical protein